MTRLMPMFYQVYAPVYPCRKIETRHCPARYRSVCGERPCARYESEDPWPWVAEIVSWDRPDVKEFKDD